MSFVKKLKNILSGSSLVDDETGSPENKATATEVQVMAVSKKATPASNDTPEEKTSQWEPEPPKERTVIQPKVIAGVSLPQDGDKILIKAQPSLNNDQCVFFVNRPLMKGYSWYFANFEAAAESPLAEALFSLDDLETILVMENTLTVTRKDKTVVDWKPLAEEVGAAVRRVVEEGSPLIADKILNDLPSEDSIREGIQKVIDTEVNPGVAGHGGSITLLSVKGNSVTIHMGGGCQGCSAADLTLKQGIHTSFRNAVPQVGAILDETDHSAGVNPYFS